MQHDTQKPRQNVHSNSLDINAGALRATKSLRPTFDITNIINAVNKATIII